MAQAVQHRHGRHPPLGLFLSCDSPSLRDLLIGSLLHWLIGWSVIGILQVATLILIYLMHSVDLDYLRRSISVSVIVPIDSRAESAIMDGNNQIGDGTLSCSFACRKCGSETPVI